MIKLKTIFPSAFLCRAEPLEMSIQNFDLLAYGCIRSLLMSMIHRLHKVTRSEKYEKKDL